MTLRSLPVRGLVLGMMLGWWGAGVAQQSTTIRSRATLVQIPVLVTTPSGDLVHTLMASDFIVTDDGVAQNVRLEPESAAPLSLVVLMQTGDEAYREFPKYSGLETMLAGVLGDQPGDAANQVAIVSFDSQIEGATPFTSDIAQWHDAIDYPDKGDRGAAIVDALAYALDLLDKQPAGNRRAIVLLSQTTDDGSKDSLKDVLRLAEQSNTAIYTFTFTPEKTAIKDALKEPPHVGPPILVNPAAGPTQGYFDLSAPLALLLASLKKNLSGEIATLTGGETIPFDDRNQLDAGMNLLANHIRNRYLLTFTPTSTRPGPHALVVKLKDRPGLTVAARTSYWAAPAP